MKCTNFFFFWGGEYSHLICQSHTYQTTSVWFRWKCVYLAQKSNRIHFFFWKIPKKNQKIIKNQNKNHTHEPPLLPNYKKFLLFFKKKKKKKLAKIKFHQAFLVFGFLSLVHKRSKQLFLPKRIFDLTENSNWFTLFEREKSSLDYYLLSSSFFLNMQKKIILIFE